jgi:cell pole-organizing protein PopZ
MAKPEPAHNQTVEEILASIRQAISEDEAKRATMAPRPAPAQPRPDNVASLFPAVSAGGQANAAGNAGEDPSQEVIDLAIEKAMDDVRAELASGLASPEAEADETAEADTDETAEAEPAETAHPQPPLEPQRPRALPPMGGKAGQPPPRPLMSPRAGAAVTASFDTLARSMASNGGIKLEDMVEGMLRPMLRSWLDDNLPGLVERLVREEIDRVSRGRR